MSSSGNAAQIESNIANLKTNSIFEDLSPEDLTWLAERMVDLRVPAGEVFQCIEAPRGEIGYYIVSDGTSKPYRVHMRTPSFGNLQALPTLLRNTLIADSIASLGSMDFVLGDTDR